MKQTILIEASHTLGHIVLKRRRLHLNGGASGLHMAMRRPEKSWLSAEVESSESPWDVAHSTAAKLKAELKEHVYVEPGDKEGRFSELTAPASVLDQIPGLESINSSVSGFGMPGTKAHRDNIGGLAGFGGSSLMPGIPHSGGLSEFSQMGLMPSVPDPLSVLPEQVRGMLAGHAAVEPAGKGRPICPALYDLPGWTDLHQTTQQMFEVEACQALAEHSFGPDVDGGLSKLLAAPLSRALRRFLDGALESARVAQETK